MKKIFIGFLFCILLSVDVFADITADVNYTTLINTVGIRRGVLYFDSSYNTGGEVFNTKGSTVTPSTGMESFNIFSPLFISIEPTNGYTFEVIYPPLGHTSCDGQSSSSAHDAKFFFNDTAPDYTGTSFIVVGTYCNDTGATGMAAGTVYYLCNMVKTGRYEAYTVKTGSCSGSTVTLDNESSDLNLGTRVKVISTVSGLEVVSGTNLSTLKPNFFLMGW